MDEHEMTKGDFTMESNSIAQRDRQFYGKGLELLFQYDQIKWIYTEFIEV